MESTQLSVSSGTNTVAAYHRQATDVAGVCKDIVHQTAQSIGGRKYVRVEGWQAIATAHGCVASARDVEKIEGGWRAIGEVRRMDTGSVIATAEGFLGTDEPVWAKRPEYAKRAMAQTRAISRACRSAFAHVVVLIGGGLETTPAEEVPAEGFSDSPRPAPAPRQVPRLKEEIIDVVAERVEPRAPIRKKQPVAAMDEGADWTTARFIKWQSAGQDEQGRQAVHQWGAFLEMDGAEKAGGPTRSPRPGRQSTPRHQGEMVLCRPRQATWPRCGGICAPQTCLSASEAQPQPKWPTDDIPF
jgi:hypothetical protein